jgi:N-acetylglucosaminyldiphosphoundecaprenol N-acetyl-beta-D-mannosaminyltransferase
MTSSQTLDFPRFTVKGIDVAAIDLARTRDLIVELAANAPGTYLTVTGAHGIVESAYDSQIREAHQQAFVAVADGMPLVWLAHVLGFPSAARVYGPDLMECVFSDPACRALRHFFYGGTPAVIERLKDTLVARFGAFNLAGMHCPPIRPAGFREDEEVIRRIRELEPHIIWIGLSTPKQELWMQMHMPRIGCGVGIGVGAAFDLLSGAKPQAPRFVQRSGLEWLFRLATEPRRLFRRYLFIVPRFSYFLFEAWLKRRASLQRSINSGPAERG